MDESPQEQKIDPQPPETPGKVKQFQSNKEFIAFLFHRVTEKKRWWLLPLLLLLIILVYVLNLPGKESILPALYFLF